MERSADYLIQRTLHPTTRCQRSSLTAGLPTNVQPESALAETQTFIHLQPLLKLRSLIVYDPKFAVLWLHKTSLLTLIVEHNKYKWKVC